jgi:hypothetical protein
MSPIPRSQSGALGVGHYNFQQLTNDASSSVAYAASSMHSKGAAGHGALFGLYARLQSNALQLHCVVNVSCNVYDVSQQMSSLAVAS